jgi:prophage antirepressor-like protein
MNSKKEVFFMEIFNEILKINNSEIMIVYDIDGNIWFGLKDIIKALGYSDIFNAKNYININKKNKKKFKKIRVYGLQHTLNMQPNKVLINEAGLYEILSYSRKPLARIFMDKYFTDIMPEIRKNGQYILSKQDMNKTKEINKELTQENIELKNNLRNVVYPKGNAIYLISKILHHKKYYKIGFTVNLNKRLKSYNTGLPNKIHYNYFIMVKSKHIDTCIKNIMKNDEFIKNKEFYLAKLSRILEFIKSCEKSLDKICCGYCLKCYRFNKIKLHKCKYAQK